MKKDSFFTSDFPLSAALLTLGFEFAGTRKDERMMFHFVRSLELDETVKKYWCNALLVEPRAFFSGQKFLKEQINMFS